MGIQESMMRAAVGDLALVGRRATAYGLGLLGAGVLLGFLYEQSLPWVLLAVVKDALPVGSLWPPDPRDVKLQVVPAASFVTGHTLVIDWGTLAR